MNCAAASVPSDTCTRPALRLIIGSSVARWDRHQERRPRAAVQQNRWGGRENRRGRRQDGIASFFQAAPRRGDSISSIFQYSGKRRTRSQPLRVIAPIGGAS